MVAFRLAGWLYFRNCPWAMDRVFNMEYSIMTPEGKTKNRVTKLLRKRGVYYYMPVSNGMGAPALDYILCHQGRFLSIECKAWCTKKDMTDRQKHTAKRIMEAGGLVFMVRDEESLERLDHWLVKLKLTGERDEPIHIESD